MKQAEGPDGIVPVRGPSQDEPASAALSGNPNQTGRGQKKDTLHDPSSVLKRRLQHRRRKHRA